MTGGLSRRSALATLAAAPIAACARRDDAALTFWAMGREGEVAQTMTRSIPGTPIVVQQLPWSAAHAKLLTAFAGGDLPDVGQIGNTWLAEFVAIGAVERLDARASASAIVRQEAFYPGVWRTNVVGGGLYGIPWYVDTRLLFYRRDILAEVGQGAPTTWAAWLAAMQAVRGRRPAGAWAAFLPLDEPEPLLTLALQAGDPLLRADGGRGNFRSAGFRRALAFYAGIFARGLAPVAAASEIGNIYDEFDRGYFTFYVTGPWNLGEFRRRLPRGRQDIWMTAPMPGPNGPGAGLAGGASLVLFRASQRKDSGWAVIEQLSDRKAQLRFFSMTGDLPSRRDAWSDPPLAGDPKTAAFRDQLSRAAPTPAVPEWERIVTEMQLAAEQVVRGHLALDEAPARIDARVDAILEKRRWLLGRRGTRL